MRNAECHGERPGAGAGRCGIARCSDVAFDLPGRPRRRAAEFAAGAAARPERPDAQARGARRGDALLSGYLRRGRLRDRPLPQRSRRRARERGWANVVVRARQGRHDSGDRDSRQPAPASFDRWQAVARKPRRVAHRRAALPRGGGPDEPGGVGRARSIARPAAHGIGLRDTRRDMGSPVPGDSDRCQVSGVRDCDGDVAGLSRRQRGCSG